MSDIDRYEMRPNGNLRGHHAGEWVRFSDVEATIKDQAKEITRLKEFTLDANTRAAKEIGLLQAEKKLIIEDRDCLLEYRDQMEKTPAEKITELESENERLKKQVWCNHIMLKDKFDTCEECGFSYQDKE